VDAQDKLMGVLPTRRLLTAELVQRLDSLMIPRVVALPHSATILDACELFVMHRFLALPVVDETRHVIGVVDVGLFTEEVLDIGAREQAEDVFESLGFRISQVRAATPWRAFRLRFPWLLATIATGTICAVLAGSFERTFANALVIAFFLTLVLALGEAVAAQSMALCIQALKSVRPSWGWFARALRHESPTALLLGTGCGGVVLAIVWLWRGTLASGVVIGSSIMLSLLSVSLFGLAVPSVLHWLKLDPKIAAGPVTLGMTDVFTLLLYLGLATWWL
jgi:magnesium transporter